MDIDEGGRFLRLEMLSNNGGERYWICYDALLGVVWVVKTGELRCRLVIEWPLEVKDQKTWNNYAMTPFSVKPASAILNIIFFFNWDTI